jgi:pimeloyl-ACP methyl ester carboxylesterase
MTSKEGADYVHADQTEHRVRPRDLGRRLVLWQGDPRATGGRVRGGGRPTQPGHAQRRRRNSNPHAGAGQRSAPAADLFNQKVEGTAWKSKPSWYIVAKNDRTVQPELQRFVAKRMGATIYEINSSHVPMLSNPGLVIDVIRTATNAVQR